MTGWSNKEALGHPLAEVFQIIDGVTHKVARNPAALAIQLNKAVGLIANCVLVRRDGYETAIEDSTAPIHDSNGQVMGAVIVFHDVSKARSMVLEMSHLAQHDVLTDLPNRMLLNDRISQAIALARRNQTQVAVMFLDLDGFKHINDSLGHSVGDKLLQSVAGRLLACVRRSDTVSRIGGDEFVILLSQVERAEDASFSARKILRSLGAPHLIGELSLDDLNAHVNSLYRFVPADKKASIEQVLAGKMDDAYYDLAFVTAKSDTLFSTPPYGSDQRRFWRYKDKGLMNKSEDLNSLIDNVLLKNKSVSKVK